MNKKIWWRIIQDLAASITTTFLFMLLDLTWLTITNIVWYISLSIKSCHHLNITVNINCFHFLLTHGLLIIYGALKMINFPRVWTSNTSFSTFIHWWPANKRKQHSWYIVNDTSRWYFLYTWKPNKILFIVSFRGGEPCWWATCQTAFASQPCNIYTTQSRPFYCSVRVCPTKTTPLL